MTNDVQTHSCLGQYLFELILASAAFFLSLIVNHQAGHYVMQVGARTPASASDLLLNFLPRADWSSCFVWGFAAFVIVAAAAAVIWEREKIIYILWMYALLISLRGLFVMLTPMGSPAGSFSLDGSFLFRTIGRHLTFGNDLFFSAHASMPFLGFLIYSKLLVRIILLLFSIMLAVTVLLCRYHYSIDVVGAYFITYALVRIHGNHMRPFYGRLIARLFPAGDIVKTAPKRLSLGL